MNYPFSSIWINGREVLLNNIEKESARSDFEKNTFAFISEWLSERTDFIIQTSGSTGVPKQITVTRDQMISSATLTQKTLQLQKGFTALVCLDTKYIAGKMMIVRSFIAGMKILAIDPRANPIEKISPQE